MYATVRYYEGVTDSSELGRRVNEGFVPIIRQISGFVDYYFIDAGGGVMISLSILGPSWRGGVQQQGCGLSAAECELLDPEPASGYRR